MLLSDALTLPDNHLALLDLEQDGFDRRDGLTFPFLGPELVEREVWADERGRQVGDHGTVVPGDFRGQTHGGFPDGALQCLDVDGVREIRRHARLGSAHFLDHDALLALLEEQGFIGHHALAHDLRHDLEDGSLKRRVKMARSQGLNLFGRKRHAKNFLELVDFLRKEGARLDDC